MRIAVMPVLLSLLGCMSHQAENSQPEVNIYSTTENPGGDERIAFLVQDKQLVFFSGPYDESVWKSDIGGRFNPVIENGVIYDRFTGISVPLNFENIKNWQIDGWDCKQTEKLEDTRSILCSKNQTSRRFLYSRARGIEGFDYPVSKGLVWFELDSPVGIFKYP